MMNLEVQNLSGIVRNSCDTLMKLTGKIDRLNWNILTDTLEPLRQLCCDIVAERLSIDVDDIRKEPFGNCIEMKEYDDAFREKYGQSLYWMCHQWDEDHWSEMAYPYRYTDFWSQFKKGKEFQHGKDA